MGFIQIETVLDDESRFRFEIESQGLYAINCLSRTPIVSPDKIWEICILRDMVVIRTADRDFRDGRQFSAWEKEDRRENNILAFDWQGNLLWNIGEIVGDIKQAFQGCCYISHAQVYEEFGIALPDQAGYLLRCIAGCWMYIIDATNRSVLHKVSGKF